MAEAPPLSPEEAYAGMLGNGGGSRTVARSVRLGVAGTILTASVLLAMLTYAIKGLPGTKLEWGQWSLHPVLMTLAFGFLAPIAATSYRGFEHIGGMSHAKAKLLHAFMQGMALLCGILGTRTMWIAHGKVGPDFHLISVHSWLGLAALIAFAFQWASGLAVFYTPLVERLTTRRGWLPFHVFIGCFATFGTLASVALGLLSFSYTKGGTPASYTTPSQIQFKVCALLVMLLCGFVGMIFATPRRGF